MQFIDIHAETDIQYESGCAWCLLLAQTLQLSSTKKNRTRVSFTYIKNGYSKLRGDFNQIDLYVHHFCISLCVLVLVPVSTPPKKKNQVDVIIYSL